MNYLGISLGSFALESKLSLASVSLQATPTLITAMASIEAFALATNKQSLQYFQVYIQDITDLFNTYY